MSNWQNAPYGLRPVCSITGGSWTVKTQRYNISTAVVNGATVGYASNIFYGDPVVWGTSLGATILTNSEIGSIAVYNPNYTAGTPSTFPVGGLSGGGAAPIIGVFVGCEYESIISSVNNVVRQSYYPANTQIMPGTGVIGYVADDPMTVFEVQLSTPINAANGNFVAFPNLPNLNANGGAPYNQAGFFGRNFALMIGGGNNFDTVTAANSGVVTALGPYQNNPATGNVRTGLSAFYAVTATTNANGGAAADDYNKTVATLPLRLIGYSREPNNIAFPGLIGGNPYTMANTPFLSVYAMLNNSAVGVGSPATVYVA